MQHSLNYSHLNSYKAKNQGLSARGGVKFFGRHKNLNSPEFAMAVESTSDTSISPKETSYNEPLDKSIKRSFLDSQTETKTKTKEKGIYVMTDDLERLKEKLRTKDLELEMLKFEERKGYLLQNTPKIAEKSFENIPHNPTKTLDRSFENMTNIQRLERNFDTHPYENRIKNNRSLTPNMPNNFQNRNNRSIPIIKTPDDLLKLA